MITVVLRVPGILPREEPLKKMGVVKEGQIGNAKVLYHKTKAIYDALVPMLEENPGLFDH